MTLQLTIADRIADRLNPLKSSREQKKIQDFATNNYKWNY